MRQKNRTIVLFSHTMASPLSSPPSSLPPNPGGRPRPPVIGVVDSGVGGLSVLPALMEAIPQAQFIIVADSGNAPYGERDDAWLQVRCATLADFLRQRGADMLVLACNTATAAAAFHLRELHPDWHIVGVEPGIKPARTWSASGRIGVMATGSTLRSARYARLLNEHGRGVEVVAQACTGLAMAIEDGDALRITSLVSTHTQPLKDAGVDVLVLGCTHYPFVRDQIQGAMGRNVKILDTAQAVARRAAFLLGYGPLPIAELDDRGSLEATDPSGPMDVNRSPGAPSRPLLFGQPEFWTSGNPATLEHFAARWLGWRIRAQRLTLA